MVGAERFGRVVEHLYEAALGGVSWASAACAMNDLIRTTGQSITHLDMGPGGELEILLSRFYVGAESRDDLRRLYYRDYYWRDEAIPRLGGLGVVYVHDTFRGDSLTITSDIPDLSRIPLPPSRYDSTATWDDVISSIRVLP